VHFPVGIKYSFFAVKWRYFFTLSSLNVYEMKDEYKKNKLSRLVKFIPKRKKNVENH